MFESLKNSWKAAKAKAEAELAAEQQQAASASALPTAADMPSYAKELVASLGARGVVLDYSLNSLAQVDRFVAVARQELDQLAKARDRRAEGFLATQVNRTGAYLGEVIRRAVGGEWVDRKPVPVLTFGSGVLNPVLVALDLIRTGEFKTSQGSIDSLLAYARGALVVQQQATRETITKGYASLQDLQSEMIENPTAAAWMVQQLEAAVDTARKRWGATLDFSVESLEALDQILGEMHRLGAQAAPGQGPTPEQLDGASKAWGVYLGEVLRRRHAGRWHHDETANALVVQIGDATVAPMLKVRKRLVNGDVDNVAFYAEGLGSILAKPPSAPPAAMAV